MQESIHFGGIVKQWLPPELRGSIKQYIKWNITTVSFLLTVICFKGIIMFLWKCSHFYYWHKEKALDYFFKTNPSVKSSVSTYKLFFWIINCWDCQRQWIWRVVDIGSVLHNISHNATTELLDQERRSMFSKALNFLKVKYA